MFLSKSPHPFWSRLALHALWLHGLWEAVQCRLFYDMNGVPFTSALLFMIAATGADVVLTLALVALALHFTHGRFKIITLWMLAACGTFAAIVIEVVALSLGWWRYSPTMLTVQFAGRSIGLLPLVQMALLPSCAVLLARSFPSQPN